MMPKIDENIDPNNDGWSADSSKLQLPFSDDCLIKILGCPSNRHSGYCREMPSTRTWDDILNFRSKGDIFQIRGRSAKVVQAVQWGDTEYSDGNEDNTYILEEGHCSYFNNSIKVSYVEPVDFEVSTNRAAGSPYVTIEVNINSGLAPFSLSTNQGYSFTTEALLSSVFGRRIYGGPYT